MCNLTLRTIRNVIWESWNIIRLLAFTIVLVITLHYWPNDQVPSTVTIRCDKLCPNPPTSYSFLDVPVRSEPVGESADEYNSVKTYTLTQLIMVICAHVVSFVLHLIFTNFVCYGEAYIQLPAEARVKHVIYALIDIALNVAVPSLVPYFACPEPFVWASFTAVVAIILYTVSKPYVTKKTTCSTRRYWYFKLVKFLLVLLNGALLVYIVSKQLAVWFGRQKEDFAAKCLDFPCNFDVYKGFCPSPSAYVNVKCNQPPSVWMPSYNIFPDTMTALFAFPLATFTLYADMYYTQFLVIIVPLLNYFLTYWSLYLTHGIDFAELNAGFVVGSLIGWLTNNIALSQLGTRVVSIPHYEAQLGFNENFPYPRYSVPCSPPTYEMVLAGNNRIVPGVSPANATAEDAPTAAEDAAPEPAEPSTAQDVAPNEEGVPTPFVNI